MNNKVLACARRRGAAAVAVLVLAAASGAAAALSTPVAAVAAAAAAAVGGALQAAAPAKAQEGPTAAEILARAIARQGVPKGVDPAAATPLVLFAKTNLQFRDDKGNDVVLDAERRFLAPDRIWTQLTDKATGTVTQSGYDGKFPWFYGAPKGVRRLDGPDNANDLKQLTSDVEITSALARALLLARLQRELKDLKRLDDATHGDAKLLVVEGDAQVDMNQKKTPTRLRLQLAEKDAQLLGVRVAFEGRDPLQMWFSRHEVAGGFEFPHKIEVFREGSAQPQLKIFVSALDLAPHFTDADFAPPTK
ncbi:MAG TPA: hypothetical protein VFG37_15290 [Planctomycetota bacterium]|nr:hypothetical protein [Planctomycetota bacterium]